jgi:hypothetical protein
MTLAERYREILLLRIAIIDAQIARLLDGKAQST